MITFGDRTVLSGHYGCVNCESVTGYFAFLVIAFGVLAFGIYAAKQRRQSHVLPKEPEQEKVLVDQEGWETKLSEAEAERVNASKKDENWQSKPSEEDSPLQENRVGDDEGWETKPEN